jgi:hypothetical protein
VKRYDPLIMIFGGLFGFVGIYYFIFWAFSF